LTRQPVNFTHLEKVTMKKVLVFLAAALLQTGAWAATYTYTGEPYSASAISNYTNCIVGDCGNFTTSMFQTGSFTTAAPLPAGLNNGDISSLITGFDFSDGLTSYSNTAGDTLLYSASAVTDANGVFKDATLIFIRWPTPAPHAPGDRYDMLILHSAALHNYECGQVNDPNNGVCSSGVLSASASVIDGTPVKGTWKVAEAGGGVNSVPTLGEWGLLLLAVLTAGAGAAVQRKSFRPG